MKKKAVTLSIPEPCHEGWNTMKPEENGRYCFSCEKVVVDFSAMHDFQILEYMQKAAGSVCGRMSSAQLDRVMHSYVPANHYPSSFSLRAVVLGAALSTFSALHVAAQERTQPAKQPVQSETPLLLGEIVSQDAPSNILTGYVTDALSGDSLAFVSIKLMSADGKLLQEFVTDENGRFEITPNQAFKADDYVILEFAQYTTNILTVSQMYSGMTIKMTPVVQHEMIMGKMIMREQK